MLEDPLDRARLLDRYCSAGEPFVSHLCGAVGVDHPLPALTSMACGVQSRSRSMSQRRDSVMCRWSVTLMPIWYFLNSDRRQALAPNFAEKGGRHEVESLPTMRPAWLADNTLLF